MKNLKRALPSLGLIAGLVYQGNAAALDITVSGFVRQEIAARTTREDNPFNQQGNRYNNVTVVRDSSLIGGFTDTATRVDPTGGASYDFNWFVTRAELDFEVAFNESLRAVAKLRGIRSWDGVNDAFRDSHQFYSSAHSGNGSLLETNGRTWMLDVPSLYLDFNQGPFWLRVGNQQIAWGESLFFRVIDVPNGLDLRRHLILDYAAEEYADERIPAPGVRGSFRADNGWEIEGFAQMSNPTVLANPNTPFNTVPDQFVVHHGDTRGAWNAGLRLKGQIGELGLQFMVVSRRNPDGVLRWTESGVNRDLPVVPGSGAVLANTPFEVSPNGVWSATEWFDYAAQVRLDGHEGLNSAVRDFQPWTGLLGAVEMPTKDLAAQELDLFFQLSGGLRGHLERVYPREEVYGVGFNYMFYSEPDSLLDQLLVRFEMTYTPNKVFTHPSLRKEFLVKDEWATSLVFEKYQRFSAAFPATFMSLQWLHKTESDLFGRHLSGNGGDADRTPTGVGGGFNAISFALQQPWPNLTWRGDLAILYDLEGGVLVQPGIRYKPNKSFTADLFANFISAKGDNNNALSTVRWADEVAIRLAYQF